MQEFDYELPYVIFLAFIMACVGFLTGYLSHKTEIINYSDLVYKCHEKGGELRTWKYVNDEVGNTCFIKEQSLTM